jgi:hypothetical protein
VLANLQAVTTFAREQRPKFIEMVQKSSSKAAEKTAKSHQTEFNKASKRITELDTIISRIYEDNIVGKISDERFTVMLASYENEQRELKVKAGILETELAELKKRALNVDRFLKLVDEYTDITELSADIARRFISRVVVHDPVFESYKDKKRIRQRKVSQEIHIYYVCIDEFIIE